ncbi:porin [Variovorax sp. dw_954]|uniref:porin n=1 Tax=Variovorax sp. dw_954 TaxID=2720078 RepID=UPI001BD478CA|nr:porin [Variovorax sp. dw_954]
MKKIAVPMILLAIAGVAGAQSSVTLFGVIDTSISSYGTKSTRYVVPETTIKQTQTVLSSNSFVPSRLGFRGTEDLGGGLSANFWLEGQLATDDGGAAFFSRRSTVSLAGPFGELRLGRDYTPTFWIDTLFDPMNNIGVGASLIGSVNGRIAPAAALSGGGLLNTQLGGALDNYIRTSNAIGYFLPPGLGGFYGQVMYALPEGIKNSLVPGSPSNRGGLYGARFGYANGPLDVAGSYVESTPVDAVAPFITPARERKVKMADLAASYDFKLLKLFGEISRTTDDLVAALGSTGAPSALTSRTSTNYEGALVGVTVPIGAGMVRSAYSYVKSKTDAPGLLPANQDASASRFAIGYVYYLSKRTLLSATAAYTRMKDAQNNPVMGILPGLAIGYVTTGGYAPRSSTGYDVGITHSF